MNCKEANEKSITGFLATIGINPAKTPINGKFWYCSPLRNEKIPSFAVWKNGSKNVWYDHGTGTGGSLIDLVCKLCNVGVPSALLIIAGKSPNIQPLSFDQPPTEPSNLRIDTVLPIENKFLIQYIRSRKICISLAELYINEVHYTVKEKPYFAVGFKNDLGGYELRNNFKSKYFPDGVKNCSSPKGITTIKGDHYTLNIFEGFFDFLSFLTWSKVTKTQGTCIILNSVKNMRTVYQALPYYMNINLYLDNDPSGEEAVNKIQNIQPDAINQAKIIYPDFKDFNEFLTRQ
jgi:hypothetical protein